MPIEAEITDPSAIKDYVTAGKSTFTILSDVTGKRFTYHIAGKDDGAIFFVSLMTGTSNDYHDFDYFGFVRDNRFTFSEKTSKVEKDNPAIAAFEWFFKNLRHGKVSSKVKVFHSGHCGRCQRPLTVPESVRIGLGPECMKYYGFKAERVKATRVTKKAA